MKKFFDKLNKVMFVAGIIALVVLVLIVSNNTVDTIEGIWSTIFLICIVVMLIVAILVVISAVLAIIEELRKDKKAFLKKFLSNVVWISIAYVVVFVLDYFHEAELPVDFNLAKLVLGVLSSAIAILGGEYMLTDHSKEEKNELHF